MSLDFEYFVEKRFETLKDMKFELQDLILNNNAKNNADEWHHILKAKLSQINEMFNKQELKKIVISDNQKNLFTNLQNAKYEEIEKADDIMKKTLSLQPDFFEIETISKVIDFANNCKTIKDFKKIWDLPKIPANLDYKNPANKYSQFMPAFPKEQIDKCLDVKNKNTVYSECYILVPNHYDVKVGLLDFSVETKQNIDAIVKKAARYIAPNFKNVLEKQANKKVY